jgi:hypothetical protein
MTKTRDDFGLTVSPENKIVGRDNPQAARMTLLAMVATMIYYEVVSDSKYNFWRHHPLEGFLAGAHYIFFGVGAYFLISTCHSFINK